ncbi:MAG TPA: YncE family protein [Candidatus Solibacter sp.]|nr:YncE family protein [Candidatus Solibacter sp.]
MWEEVMPTVATVPENVRQGDPGKAFDRICTCRCAREDSYPRPGEHAVYKVRTPCVLIILLVQALLPVAIPSLVHAGQVHHYEYVFPDNSIYVYDMDNRGALVKHVSVPTSAGVRGAIASAASGMLYISYGSNRRGGSLLKYNLMTDEVVWTKNYPFGVDSMSISPDGNTIYMPTGEAAPGGIWEVIDAESGKVTASIDCGGIGPHNTVVSPDGSRVYLGPRYTNYLVVASTRSNRVIRKIGPVGGIGGIRPFTINGAENLAFITLSGVLGFQVGDIGTGRILYTVQVQGFPTKGGAPSSPSHGISLSPDEKEVYIIDSISNYVHVFDVTGLPGSAPRQVADIQLLGAMSHNETPCAYNCRKYGWLHHSRDGRYVFVGDSGDVIDTALRKTAMTLPALANSRTEIEIDFQVGAPLPIWAMTNRSSIGGRAPVARSSPFSGVSTVR